MGEIPLNRTDGIQPEGLGAGSHKVEITTRRSGRRKFLHRRRLGLSREDLPGVLMFHLLFLHRMPSPQPFPEQHQQILRQEIPQLLLCGPPMGGDRSGRRIQYRL